MITIEDIIYIILIISIIFELHRIGTILIAIGNEIHKRKNIIPKKTE